MATVSLSRPIPADPETVASALTEDVEALMRAAGFDTVDSEGDRLHIERRLGLATLSLTLRRVDSDDAVLAFEQVDGVFEEMSMAYFVEPASGGSEVRGWTEFTLGGLSGGILDDTFVRRQRTGELEAQFDYIKEAVGE